MRNMTELLNRVLAAISGVSGIGMLTLAAVAQNTSTALTGFGAIAMAVILFQMADMRERMTRLENLFMKAPEK